MRRRTVNTVAAEQCTLAGQLSYENWHLNDLLEGWVPSSELTQDRVIDSLALDSRRVVPGALFFACRGVRQAGHEYIRAAVDKGAVAVVYDPAVPLTAETQVRLQTQKIPLVAMPALGAKVGIIADRFYGQPSRQVRVTGVTGTNGKTSVSHFLARALHQEKAPCGVMGTLGLGLIDAIQPSELTTADAVTVQARLAEMRDAGVRHVVMEVSSHALDQGRVNGVNFDTAIFTNLSHEHLDYHGDMACYQAAKAQLFQKPGLSHAVINTDDIVGGALLANLPAGVTPIGYGLANSQADLRASEIRYERSGIVMNVHGRWGDGKLRCPLQGRFNAYNLLAALGGLLAAGMPFAQALQRLSLTQPVPGRMESMGGEGRKPLVIVDYAHTPDALEQALGSLRAQLDPGGRLWCVFGCGGERDRKKRPSMGAVAERGADFVMLTEDNPRGEDPVQIILDILAGFENPDRVYQFRDRAKAIAKTVQLARSGDIVLIAGKGHEDYQQRGAERRLLNDRQLVQQALQQWKEVQS